MLSHKNLDVIKDITTQCVGPNMVTFRFDIAGALHIKEIQFSTTIWQKTSTSTVKLTTGQILKQHHYKQVFTPLSFPPTTFHLPLLHLYSPPPLPPSSPSSGSPVTLSITCRSRADLTIEAPHLATHLHKNSMRLDFIPFHFTLNWAAEGERQRERMGQ